VGLHRVTQFKCRLLHIVPATGMYMALVLVSVSATGWLVQPPDTSRPSCRKRTLKQEEPGVCQGPGVNDGPTQQLVRSFQNEVVGIYTVEEGQGSYQRERERESSSSRGS